MQISGMQLEAAYWELRNEKDADGRAVEGYRIYVLVSIPERVRKAAEKQAMDALSSSGNADRALEKLQDQP